MTMRGEGANMGLTKRMGLFGLTGLLAAFACAIVPAKAQNFPTKPITLIVPWPAGGATDRHLRVLAEATSKHLGQPIVIDNKPGASGTLGAATMVATAKPDGYTLAQLPITVFRLPYMQKVAFDPKKDFSFVIHLTGYTFGTAVNAKSPWKTWADLLSYAKANPGKIRYATPGAGTTLHITMEQIALQQGLKWTQVPFRGEAEMTASLLGEHVEAAAGGTGMGPLVDSGDFRMLVVWTEKRSPRFPDSPTLVEEGHKIISESPYGLAGPKGMDPKIIQILHDAFKKGMEDPMHLSVLKDLSQPLIYKNSADYQAFAMQLIEEQQALIKQLGLGAK
jgi:tripartite-type tricarboxylate transporter receptor subunit TctC